MTAGQVPVKLIAPMDGQKTSFALCAGGGWIVSGQSNLPACKRMAAQEDVGDAAIESSHFNEMAL